MWVHAHSSFKCQTWNFCCKAVNSVEKKTSIVVCNCQGQVGMEAQEIEVRFCIYIFICLCDWVWGRGMFVQ